MLERRGFLALTCGAVTAAAAGCTTAPGTTPGPGGSPAPGGEATLPNHVSFAGVTPDGPSTPDGVMAMFKQFPADHPSFGPETLSDADPVTILSQTDGAAPPPLPDNPYWRELNRRIGVEMQFNMVPAADLAAKQSVAIAGGDGPDLMQVKGRKSIPQMAQVLESTFADLTDFVGGDAVEKYAGLANIPTWAWESTVFNGRIYGVPQTSGNVGDILFVRQDLLDARGVSAHPSTEEEFFETCAALTDPRDQKWALNSATTTYGFMLECLGVAADWQVVDGRFVHSMETEESVRALEILARLWSEGLVHPDAFSGQGALTEWFSSGISAMNRGGLRFADIVESASTNPDLQVGLVKPFSIDGSAPTKHLTNGTAGFTAVKKGSPERIHELLTVLNFVSPPFGSEESLFRLYGVEGEQFEFVEGEPTVIEAKAAQLRLPLAYVGRGPLTLYSPGRPDSAQAQYDYQVEVIPDGVLSAVEMLSSPTDERDGANLTRNVNDVRDRVIQGKASIKDWQDVVAEWRTQGGDTIRDEYAQSAEENS